MQIDFVAGLQIEKDVLTGWPFMKVKLKKYLTPMK